MSPASLFIWHKVALLIQSVETIRHSSVVSLISEAVLVSFSEIEAMLPHRYA